MFWPVPSVTGLGELLIVRNRSELGALTVVTEVAVLLTGLKSVPALDTLAVLLSVPGPVGAATMVTPALSLTARLPMLQVTTPLAFVQLPTLALAETRVTSAGSVSVTVTPVAATAPLLLTRMD